MNNQRKRMAAKDTINALTAALKIMTDKERRRYEEIKEQQKDKQRKKDRQV